MIKSSKKCKKSNDVRKLKNKSKKHTVVPQPPVTLPPSQVSAPTLPNLSVLRQDAYIQAQVEQRLKNLVEDSKSGTKIKSLRGGSVEVVVPHRVKWPQEYVLAGSKKERVQYDQLSMSQWVAGFCRIMRDETDAQNKDSMLDYLISLLEDAQDFSWDAARASHAVLLCRMEQGDVKNYKDVDKIDRIRRANAQRHLAPSHNISNVKNRLKNPTRQCLVRTLIKELVLLARHMIPRVSRTSIFMQHALPWGGKTYPHPEIECRNKN